MNAHKKTAENDQQLPPYFITEACNFFFCPFVETTHGFRVNKGQSYIVYNINYNAPIYWAKSHPLEQWTVFIRVIYKTKRYFIFNKNLKFKKKNEWSILSYRSAQKKNVFIIIIFSGFVPSDGHATSVVSKGSSSSD